MPYETSEGVPLLSYGELNDLTRNLEDVQGGGLGAIFQGEALTMAQARATFAAARLSATSDRAHSVIDRVLERIKRAQAGA